VQKKLRQAYWTYVDDIVTTQPTDQNIHNSQKRFWTFIKHKKKDNQTIIGLKEHGQLHSDPKSKANILNRQFQSVFTDNITVSADDFKKGKYINPQSTHPVAPEISITTPGITKLLLALNPYKAAGPDTISPRILKELATDIALYTYHHLHSFNRNQHHL